MQKHDEIMNLDKVWATDSRWAGVIRPYTAAEVERLQGTVQIEHTLARLGVES